MANAEKGKRPDGKKKGVHPKDIEALARQAKKDPKALDAFLKRFTFAGFPAVGPLRNKEKSLVITVDPEGEKTN